MRPFTGEGDGHTRRYCRKLPSGQDKREKSKRICKATKAYLTSERKVGVKKPTTRYSATEYWRVPKYERNYYYWRFELRAAIRDDHATWHLDLMMDFDDLVSSFDLRYFDDEYDILAEIFLESDYDFCVIEELLHIRAEVLANTKYNATLVG